jgi:hypothetical protein
MIQGIYKGIGWEGINTRKKLVGKVGTDREGGDTRKRCSGIE